MVLLLSLSAPSILTAQTQPQPVKFQYSTRSYFNKEGDKLYLVSECQVYEGTSCTMPGSAHRYDVTGLKNILSPFSGN